VIRILGQDGQTVYEGEGELIIEQSDNQLDRHPRRIALRQMETRPTESRGRELDLTGFLREVQAEYRFSPRSLDMRAAWMDEPVVPPWAVPEPHLVAELVIQRPADELSWLADILNQSFETSEERRAAAEARREQYRQSFGFGVLSGPEVRADLGILPGMNRAEQNRIDWAALRERIREAGEALSGLDRAARGCGFLGQAMQQAIEAEAEEASFTAANARAAMDQVRENHRALQSCAPEDFRAYVREAYGIPAGLIGPDPAHDELIESTLSEFPHDPYQYGRIWPGPEGTSRWTPPEDPEEKIRSCP
jgi:hypothetical protein